MNIQPFIFGTRHQTLSETHSSYILYVFPATNPEIDSYFESTFSRKTHMYAVHDRRATRGESQA